MKKLYACLLSGFLFTVTAGAEEPLSLLPVPDEVAPLKIGVAGVHSGPLAPYGLPTLRAVQLLVDEYNRNGGLLGRRVELVIKDDQCMPDIAFESAQVFIEEEVVGVIGHICSGATKRALELYEESGLVYISPSSTVSDLTENGGTDCFFRTIPPDFALPQVLVDYIAGLAGSHSLAILADRGAYGQNNAIAIHNYAETRGFQVVLIEAVDQEVPNCSELVEAVRRSGANIVVWSGFFPEAAKIVQQMREQGMEQLFIAGDGVYDNKFLQYAGEYAEGVLAVGPMDSTTNPLAIEAAKACRERYGEEPGPFFYNAFAAAKALLAAIDRVQSVEAQDIQRSFRENYVDTPLGSISFDHAGDVLGYGYTVYQVENGAFVPN